MNIKAAAACAIVVGGFAAWYALSAGADRRGPAQSRVVPAAPLDATAARRWRTKSRGLAAVSSRSRRRSTHATCSVSRQRRREKRRRFRSSFPCRPEAPAPPRPAFRLIGVAEDNAAGNPVRTAIISAPDQLYVVREGERVTSRYGVARISADVVELVDTGDSTALRLALK